MIEVRVNLYHNLLTQASRSRPNEIVAFVGKRANHGYAFLLPNLDWRVKLMTMPAANTAENAAPVLRDSFPRMMVLRQQFPASPPLDVSASLEAQFAALRSRIKPGSRLAVAVGSRGISNLQRIVAAVLGILKGAGAQPFLVPAMGSHGGATPEGQKQILAEYALTEERLQVPIHAAMDVERIGATPEGLEVFFSAEARRADGIVVVNRVKPHTDFSSESLGSGILKMMVVGLGKRVGAANYHTSSSRRGYEEVLRSMAQVILRSAPIFGGVAIVEDQFHSTARVTVLPVELIERGEAELFREAKRLMPKLPFDDIDLLIVDRLGKNISGAGMDPNIIGRGVHGYSSLLGHRPARGPTIRRLFVRELTPETHGNAVGIGLADVTTARLARSIDLEVTRINALTALTPQCAKIPVQFETDREAIERTLASLALREPSEAKIVRIADTLSLEKLEVSEACAELFSGRKDLEVLGRAEEMRFDDSGNLLPLRVSGAPAQVGHGD